MKRIIVLLITLTSTTLAFGQEPADALRYSYMTGQGGTARSQAIGGAGVSLGGEFSTLFSNPAGLGFYKTADIILTPVYYSKNNDATYLGNLSNAQKGKLLLNTSGILFSNPRNYGKVKAITIGLGINRTADFNNSIYYTGINNQSSYSEKFLEQLISNHVTDPNAAAQNYPFGPSMAFNTFLIDTLLDANHNLIGYRSLANPQYGLTQSMDIRTSGGITDASLGVGVNVSDKWYFGGSVSLPMLHYKRRSFYKESDIGNHIPDFNFFTADETLETRATGVNAKLGIIYQPVDRLRLGFAFHTPTYYFQVTDLYNLTIVTDLEGYAGPGDLKQSSTDLNNGDMLRSTYALSTPMRATLGGTYFLGIGPDLSQQKGFITADVEYVNYKQAKFHDIHNDQSYKSYFQTVNSSISGEYNQAINLRLGGELKFTNWMVRLGGAYYGNPYKYENAHTARITGGVGYRNKGFFIDLSYAQVLQKDINYPYVLNDVANPPAYLSSTGSYIGITFGFKYF